MKMNFLANKSRTTIAVVGIGALALFGSVALNATHPEAFKTNTNVLTYERTSIEYNHDEMLYLSDLDYVKSQSSSGWKEILNDITSAGSLISVKVQGAAYNFQKGIWAHAPSTLVYDISEYDYNYFTSFVGLNTTAASSSNGVKYFIYTSVDGVNWDLRTSANPAVLMPGGNADYVQIDIKDVNFLKIVFNHNGSNGNDHSVLADAKLLKSLETTTFVKTLDEYDRILKEYDGSEISGEYEKILLQRELVRRAGDYAINRFASESEENLETLNWLLNDLDTLRLYILGGMPAGNSYYNSLKVLSRFYHNYKDDWSITEVTKYGTVLGDLYHRMAIAISLTHSQRVALWMQPGAPENQSDALTRYEIYKMLHKEGKFVVSARQDHTKWFENLNVEEMRFVMNNIIDDEEILWLNEYTQRFIDAHPNQEELYLQPHKYMKYIDPNYGKPIYHDEANKEMWSEKYGNFLDYGVTFRPGLYKLWMNIDNGAVCGGISKIGTNIRAVHGTPSTVIGQPQHAALIYYRENADGLGYWTIDNNVSGWQLSEKGERMLLGWGNDIRYITGHSVSYMVAAQEALNRQDELEKSQELVMLAEVYNSDSVKKEAYLREALNNLDFNIDAWYELIALYNADSTKTEADYFRLAEELSEHLMEFPLPYYNLIAKIAPNFTSSEYKFKYALLLTDTLKKGTKLTSTAKVLQPSITNVMANYLLGKTDTKLATFSFSGANAGKIVLSSRFDNSGIRWDYSLDGKNTWKEVNFSADEDHSILLTEDELNSITAENDIYIHIVGVSYDDANLYSIDILSQNAPIVYNNDLENKVIGTGDFTEWKMAESATWHLFADQTPDLTGDKTIIVRNQRNGVYLTSPDVTLTFTQDIINDKRKYVTIDRLELVSYSSEAAAQKHYASYIIDGNANTYWHSAWNGSDTEKYIIIKFDKKINLSALEYQPINGGNGKILNAKISGSLDGENFDVIVPSTSWANNTTLKSAEIEDAALVQYVKIEGIKTSSASSLSFIAGSMFNFYEDITKVIIPKADLEYSTTEYTNEDVTVKLVNPNMEFTILNNDGSDTYTFTENGEFTFEIEDTDGNKNAIKAVVNNIDKEAPTANVTYSKTSLTNEDVIVTLTDISSDATIINNDGNNTYTFTKNGTFAFVLRDKAGNETVIDTEVNYIDKEKPAAKIVYTTLPDGSVKATLTDASKPIIITNNDGKASHIFTKNGIFIFIYKDALGNMNSSIATVTTIKETAVINPEISELGVGNINVTKPSGNNSVNPNNNIINNNPTVSIQNVEPKEENNTNATEEKEKALSAGIFELDIDKKLFTKEPKFRAIKSELTESLQNMVGESSEYYQLTLQDSDNNDIALPKKATLKIKIAQGKTIEDIYILGIDNILEKVDFTLVGNEAHVELSELSRIVITYKLEEKEAQKEEVKEDKKDNLRANYNMITIGAMLVAAGVTGLILAKKKNKEDE